MLFPWLALLTLKGYCLHYRANTIYLKVCGVFRTVHGGNEVTGSAQVNNVQILAINMLVVMLADNRRQVLFTGTLLQFLTQGQQGMWAEKSRFRGY
jgi:hypothetical protein